VEVRHRRDEGGWGLLLVLVALAIVAFLARDVLTAYLGGATRAAGADAARPSEAPGHAAEAPAPAMQRPVERARAVEDTVARGAAERAKALEERSR
jgi:hypothetical protein